VLSLVGISYIRPRPWAWRCFVAAPFHYSNTSMPPRPSMPTHFIQSILSGILDCSSQYGFRMLRILRLHPLGQALRRYRRKHESPKVSLYHNRKIAVISIFLTSYHLLQLSSLWSSTSRRETSRMFRRRSLRPSNLWLNGLRY
jgi:hypothetical protein